MEIYDYYTNNGLHKFGFKIWTRDDRTELAYEASGFDSYSAAEERMNEVLASLKTPDLSLRENQYIHMQFTKENKA